MHSSSQNHTHRRLCPCPFHTHRRLCPWPFVQKATRGSSQAEQRVAWGAALGAQAQMQTAFHQAHMCAFQQLGRKGCSSSGNPGKRPNTANVQSKQKRATPAQSPAFCSTSKGSRMRGEKTLSLFNACVPAPILSPRFSLRKARQGTGPREAPSTEKFRVQTQPPPKPSLASSELPVKQASWSEVAVLTHNTVFPETCQREAPLLLRVPVPHLLGRTGAPSQPSSQAHRGWGSEHFFGSQPQKAHLRHSWAPQSTASWTILSLAKVGNSRSDTAVPPGVLAHPGLAGT